MPKEKKKLLIVGVALLLIVLVGGGLVLYNQNDNSSDTATEDFSEFNKTLSDADQKALDEAIPNPELRELVRLSENGEYTKIVEKATVLCPSLEIGLQQTCFATHAIALMELDNVQELAVLIESVLLLPFLKEQAPGVVADWQFQLDNAKQGMNPKGKFRQSEEEARS